MPTAAIHEDFQMDGHVAPLLAMTMLERLGVRSSSRIDDFGSMLLPILIASLVGYLLGSLPFGYLVARAKGVNIFEVGSKNPGATNVRRVLGKGPGNLVLFLDALKGAVASGLPLLWFWSRNGILSHADEAVAIAGIVGAMLGH